MEGIHTGSTPTKRSNSRNGPVLMVEEPVTITYSHPRERVLFNAARDANPFLHLYEALWMLAGREDVAPLAYYTKNFMNYSDDGVTLNGAYGYRWRHADTDVEPRDQLEILIEHLQNKPESRRAVLQMWNVADDLMMIDESRDVCCNLSAMFSIREERNWEAEHKMAMPFPPKKYLDMTVTNRSNDMIWGTLGANIVHFSVLLEYMAAHLGVEVGVYNQFSNNMHVYENNWNPHEWLAWVPSEEGHYEVFPLVKDPVVFDEELPRSVGKDWTDEAPFAGEWKEPFFAEVVDPMLRAFGMYKSKDYSSALYWAQRIRADDWRIAARGWLERRINKKEKSNGT